MLVWDIFINIAGLNLHRLTSQSLSNIVYKIYSLYLFLLVISLSWYVICWWCSENVWFFWLSTRIVWYWDDLIWLPIIICITPGCILQIFRLDLVRTLFFLLALRKLGYLYFWSVVLIIVMLSLLAIIVFVSLSWMNCCYTIHLYNNLNFKNYLLFPSWSNIG